MIRYIAHAAIRLKDDVPSCEKEKWNTIKQKRGIEYRWRLCRDLTYEVICGLYSNKYEALHKAKQVYVSLLYWMLKDGFSIDEAGCEHYYPRLYNEELDGSLEEYIQNEKFFFWNMDNPGGRLGPGVFEVSNSIEEFSDYNLSEIQWYITLDNVNLDFPNIDDHIFLYSQEAQEYLKSVIYAEKATSIGMKMTIYCGLLEHLSTDGKKEQAVIDEIDRLIQIVDAGSLSKKNKELLKTYLGTGKRLSARQKCIMLCEEYANKTYREYSAKKVFEDAYSLRSKFSHGETEENFKLRPAYYMKYVVLDIIKKKMQERENYATEQ